MERLPDFFRSRVEEFYKRYCEQWGNYPIARSTRQPGKNDVVLQSNDYLSLAQHPQIISAQLQALKNSGSGPNMSAVYQEEDDPQRVLENQLAGFVGHERAVMCQSGYNANVGLIPCLSCEGTPIYIDMLCHSSLWWGAFISQSISKAKLKPFHHNSPEHLHKLVRKYGVGVIIFETIYSTNGSVSPIEDFVKIGKENGCINVVDESHSFGIMGHQGRGLVHEKALTRDTHFITVSLAKAFAGVGGFFSCPNITEFFRYNHHPAIFSSATEPHMAVRFIKTLDIIKKDDWRRKRLRDNADFLRNGLDSLGYNVSDSNSQIISIEPGTEANTVRVKKYLEKNGVFGSVFCSPATAKNRALIRFSVNCMHSMDQLCRVLDVCAPLVDELKVREWPSTRRKLKNETAKKI
jgi:CAI-1 autoinducer synthase